MRDLIRRILHEETQKSLVPIIRKLIDGVIVRQYEKEICDVDIDVIEAGELGYCRFLKFKCAAARTCDAWVVGGPIK
jgi:hypothetical protein